MASRFRTRGHPGALAFVERAVHSERTPHALLIEGPPGIGKTTLALDLAAGMLCLEADPSARPCRDCASCRKVDHDNHPDLHRLRPEGPGEQIRLAQVQRLTGELALMALEGRLRMAIVEAAHRLNPDAQNALLKTLEEPVGPTCVVLVADDPSQILPTVTSRAARLRLGPVPVAEIARLLVDLGFADAPTATSAARAARGRVGAAQELVADPEASLVGGRLTRSLLDLTSADRRTRLARVTELLADAALLDAPRPAEPQPRAARGARPSPVERRRATVRILGIWRDLGRDLAVVGHGGTAQIRDHTLLEDLRRVALEIERPALLGFLERLDGLIAAIEEYANPELCLDALVLAWPRTNGTGP